MQKKSLFLLTILFCMIFAGSLFSIVIEDNMEAYTEENAVGYVKPLIEGLGANMNRGWYHSAKIPKNGLRLRIGLAAMVAPMTDKDKTFEATTEGDFTPQQTEEVPTAVGAEENVTVQGSSGSYVFPGGLDISMIPFAAPQVTIGAVMGTEATLRLFNSSWLSLMDESDIGEISLLGLGVRHSISQYIPLCPIDIAAGFFYQSIDVGDGLIKFTTSHIGVQASRGLGPLLLYAGIGLDNSNAKIEYEYIEGNDHYEISMDIDGDNGVQMTAGLGFNLLILHLNIDASFGVRTAYSAGVHIGL
jgi:hypothetical protein